MLLQAATAPASFQAADTSAQSAGVQAPSAGAYQGSNMQTQASTQGQADYQGSNLQQAPTFGLVCPDSSVQKHNQMAFSCCHCPGTACGGFR